MTKEIFKKIDECPKKYEGKLPSRFIDITGDTYNFLSVLYLVRFKNKRAEWLCKCNKCGNYVIVNSHNLRTGHTKSCGCIQGEKLRKDLIGKEFGYLKVLNYAGSKNGMPQYEVLCQNCGKKYIAYGHGIERQYSCGCISSKKVDLILKGLRQSSLDHHQKVQTEKTFQDCIFRKPLRFDFYIPPTLENKNGFLIEYDGEQHYKPIKFGSIDDSKSYQNFIGQQTRDWYKDFYCIKNNIPLLRIKYSKEKQPSFSDLLKNSYIVGEAQASDDIINLFDINTADFVNYKDPSFTIQAGVTCTFKCCPNNPELCHNNKLIKENIIHCSINKIINDYLNQKVASSIVFQGLETLDNIKQILWFIYYFRQYSQDNIIIYTGYTEEECKDFIYLIKDIMKYKNIIIKFGRFVPNQPSHFDEVLGVNLVSPNQYAKKIC